MKINSSYDEMMERADIEVFVRAEVEKYIHGPDADTIVKAIADKWEEDVSHQRSDAYGEGAFMESFYGGQP